MSKSTNGGPRHRCAPAGALFLALVLSAATIWANDVAVIIKVKGSVTYQAPGNESWKPALAGQLLGAGSQIRTDADGLAMVKFLADGGMMRLKPQSRLTLAATNEADHNVSVQLGSTLFDVHKRPADDDPFTISTPTSVATVKGTRFWITVRADSTTVLNCLEGTVRLTAASSRRAGDVEGGMSGTTNGNELNIQPTDADDLPAGEQTLELRIQFKDSDGSTKTLRIESEPSD